MKKALIDTSVLIDFLRVKTKKTLYEAILAKRIKPAASFITVSELWAGKSVWQNKNKNKSLETLLAGIEVVFPRPADLKKAGKIKAQYNISLPDALIAVAALAKKLPLATLNIKDFKKIKGIKLLKL